MNSNVIEPTAAEGVGTEFQEGDITKKQPVYTFRKLASPDIFLMAKIISKIGINEFKDVYDTEKLKELVNGFSEDGKLDTSAIAAVGFTVIMDVVNVILRNLPNCEQEVYQMLADTSNLTLKQVKQLDLAVFVEMVIDFVKKDEFKDFIGVVSKLFK